MGENQETFLCFATALAYILQNDQGIFVQLKHPDYIDNKYLVYRDLETQTLQVNVIEPDSELYEFPAGQVVNLK